MSRSDPQAEKVYRMETQILGGHAHHRTTLKTLRQRAKELGKRFNVPVPTIAIRKLSEGTNWVEQGVYDPDRNSIQLHPEAMNLIVFAHEFAHHIMSRRHENFQLHGPRWVGYYARVLDILRLVPQAGILAACRNRRIRYQLPE